MPSVVKKISHHGEHGETRREIDKFFREIIKNLCASLCPLWLKKYLTTENTERHGEGDT